MTVENLISLLLAQKGKASMVAALASVKLPPASKETKKEIKRHIDILGCHLQSNRRREAMATALALMRIDAEYTIPRLRRAGLLRTSRYNFQGACIASIVDAVLQVRHLLKAESDRFIYLESVLALTRLAPNVRKLHEDILTFLWPRKDKVLKTLLVIVNSGFYLSDSKFQNGISLNSSHYTIEEISEAVSLLFSIYRKNFKLTDTCANLIDEKEIKSEDSTYEKLLIDALHIVKFKEAEILIDGLPYQASLSERTVTVSSIDPDIEKSVRLGYIQHDVQIAIRARGLSQTKRWPSIKEFVKHGFKEGLENAIEIVNDPIRRLRLKIPTASEVFNIFSTDMLFGDDIQSLLGNLP